MLDLVARHHLSINQEEPSGLVFKKPEWRFNWLRGEDSLAPWEARLLGSLIGSGNSITTRELRRQNGNIALPNAKKDLDELNDQAGYFTKSHRQARLGIVAIGVALIILGILGFVSGFPFLLGGGSAIVYFVLTFVTFVAGILFLGLSRKVRPPRSALGTAVTDQVRGIPRLLGYHQGGADPDRGGPRHLLGLPFLGRGLRHRRPLGHPVRTARG